mmetsp:Transcript_14759/g.57906  ORF Transcript_14759/g.57906 Transcript_14759/m.57906 type:complete len:243 (-) Transcript_14759:507-1235(-)
MTSRRRPPRQPSSNHAPPQRPTGRGRGRQQGRLEVRLVRRFRPPRRRRRVAQHRPPAPPSLPRNVLGRGRGRSDDVLTHGAARALGDEPGVDAVLVERVAAVQRPELVAALVILDAHRARVAGAVVHHERIVLAVLPRGRRPAAGIPAQEAQHALSAGEHRRLGHGGDLLRAEQTRLRRPRGGRRREVRLLPPLQRHDDGEQDAQGAEGDARAGRRVRPVVERRVRRFQGDHHRLAVLRVVQ